MYDSDVGTLIIRLDASGPHHPVAGSPGRHPGSVRRTSTITTSRPDGIAGPALVEGAARDLVTSAEGAMVVGVASVHAVVDPFTRALESLVTEPGLPGLDALLSVPVASGFRSRVDAAVPDAAVDQNLLYLLLDDLPGATLVSGYAFLRADAVRPDDRLRQNLKVDICAGWAEDATMIASIRETGQTPTPFGPSAPPVADGEDPLAWHPMSDPGPHGTRRARRLDVGGGGHDGTHEVDAWFRDSHWSEEDGETVIHEYSVAATVDATAGTVVSIAATPNVLPWMECPAAIASAQRVAGQSWADLRLWVRRDMTGMSTCTHLNDTLRSLADIGALLELLGVSPQDVA